MSENKKTKFLDNFSACCKGDFAQKIFATLLGILLVYTIVLVGTMIRNNLHEYSYIGQADRQERTITVSAEGKVTATPDIAMTSMGMVVQGETVADAQAENSRVMNKLIEKLKGLGVSEDDIQTRNYNIYPRYAYLEEKGRELTGYEVSQSVSIKIRDLDRANEVLALAGEVGANSVSGLSFTIDDRDVYKTQARDEAIKKIGQKVRTLSESLGVRFVAVVSFDEYDGAGQGPRYYEARTLDAFGAGGGEPDIEAGSMDVSMNVSVTFEIR